MNARTWILAGGWLACFAASGDAREWYVDVTRGHDGNEGTEAAPLATAQRAVDAATPGDTIHLLPVGAVYRQSMTFKNRSGLTIEGHEVTLDGSDPLPEGGWENVGDGLRRRKLPRTVQDRHLLSFDGRTERMGRTQSRNARPFPKPADLKDGQFCVEAIDDKHCWLYVRGEAGKLEWSTRMNGLATGGENRGIVVRNLMARRFLNDGFNLHGNAVEMRFDRIDGYDCFDEGFSAHETCECLIEHGRFWGNENAIADVNFSRTEYRHCEFHESVGTDVLLAGAGHKLIDCLIVNTPPSTAISFSVRNDQDKDSSLILERVRVRSSVKDAKPIVRFDGGQVSVRACDFGDADLTISRNSKVAFE
jgi:hypothetical protein